MFEWRNLYRGFFIGISDLIPGVSGGTIAVILGIYDRLIAAINGFFSKHWYKHIGFLIPLAIGVGTALISLSHVIKWLLNNFSQPTMFFFLGLIIGIIPLLLIEVDYRNTFSKQHYIILIISALLIALTDFISPMDGTIIETITFKSGLGLFFAGWLGSMAMLLPGISGSLVLLLLGVYYTALNALSTFNLPIIFAVGSGVIVGFIVSSKIIRYLLINFRTIVYAVIIGLVIGSTVVIFPGITTNLLLLLISCGTFFSGLLTALILGNKN